MSDLIPNLYVDALNENAAQNAYHGALVAFHVRDPLDSDIAYLRDATPLDARVGTTDQSTPWQQQLRPLGFSPHFVPLAYGFASWAKALDDLDALVVG